MWRASPSRPKILWHLRQAAGHGGGRPYLFAGGGPSADVGHLWTIYALFHLIGAGILFVLANTFFPHIAEMPRSRGGPPLTFLVPLLTFISILILAKGLLALAGGIGLLQKQHWARLIALVSAFLSLLSIPIGTALGVYTIWVLMSANGEQEYAKLAGPDA